MQISSCGKLAGNPFFARENRLIVEEQNINGEDGCLIICLNCLIMEVTLGWNRIRAFVFDMDGVLTDGTVIVQNDGQWIRRMHIRDGYALQLAVRQGYRVAVISGSDAPPVTERLKVLGIYDISMKVKDKKSALADFVSRTGIDYHEILFMGDDVPDIAAMKTCGIAACPADAAIDVIDIANHVSIYTGGNGCVREVIERVLRSQDRWEDVSLIRSL